MNNADSKPKGSTKTPKQLILDITDYNVILHELDEAARENIRTVEQQALWYVVDGLKRREAFIRRKDPEQTDG